MVAFLIFLAVLAVAHYFYDLWDAPRLRKIAEQIRDEPVVNGPFFDDNGEWIHPTKPRFFAMMMCGVQMDANGNVINLRNPHRLIKKD